MPNINETNCGSPLWAGADAGGPAFKSKTSQPTQPTAVSIGVPYTDAQGNWKCGVCIDGYVHSVVTGTSAENAKANAIASTK